MREQSTRKKVLFPIGLKLNLIFGTLLLIALVLVSFFTTYLVSQDVRVNAEDNNLSINTRAAAAVTNEFSSIQNTCLQFLDIYASQSNNKMAQEEISQLFFERNKDILSLLVLSEESSTPYIRIENIRYFLENELDIQDMDLFVSQSSDTLAKTVNGEVCLSNASPAFSSPILALFFPYENNLLSYVAVALFSADRVANVLGAGRINTTFVVNGNNELLFHPDSELMNSAQSMTNHPLMEILKERGLLAETSGIQIPFFTKD
ncbi:MAG: hypothetical protein IJR49_02280, partial [Treponema sp.]|nr:hypothetical protein [Treponema sp.]